MSTSAIENGNVTNGSNAEESLFYDVDYMDYLDYAVVKDAPLDLQLKTLDEEFTNSFEKRMSKITNFPDLQFVQDGDDLHKTIQIFRSVAQQMGDDWKPVFLELMKNYSKDVIDTELKQLENHKPILRGYRALMIWKELVGSRFHMTKLIDALKVNKMDDIAQNVLNNINEKTHVSMKPKQSFARKKRIVVSQNDKEPIENTVLLSVAKKLSADWKKLGEALGTDKSEMEDIEKHVGAQHEKSFKILWNWKEEAKKNNPESCVENLKKVLITLNRHDVVDEFFKN